MLPRSFSAQVYEVLCTIDKNYVLNATGFPIYLFCEKQLFLFPLEGDEIPLI